MSVAEAHPTQRSATIASEATSISHRLADFVVQTDATDLPANVVQLAKGRILDALATAFAARRLPVPAVATAFVGSAQGPATVFGSRLRRPVVDAAFINGTLVNGCTHDDYIGKLHAGAVVVPAAFAIAEEEGASGAALIAGVVLGYDVGARAYFGGPSMHPRFRGTGVAGAVAAAAAAAKLMRLSAVETGHALGLSTMFASGTQEGFVAGTMDVKLNVGWAARSGVSAALLARCGATAAPDAFEGAAGFFAAFAGTTQQAGVAVRDLGRRYLIEDTSFKERPVCIFVQTPVQLARDLALAHGLATARIDRVLITVPLATLNNPGHRNVAPFASQLQARISVKFTVAAALLGRPVESYKYFDHFDDADVLALSDRIDVVAGPDDVTVSIAVEADGRRFATSGLEMDQLTPSLDKSIDKYRRLMSDLPKDAVDEILQTVLDLDRLPDVRTLTELLRAISD